MMERELLNENEITDILAAHLNKEGCTNVDKLTTKQRGIDMTVTYPDGTKELIEVKGETSSKEGTNRFGKGFNGNQIWTHISVALMKTFTLMELEVYKGAKFSIALPFNHEAGIERVRTVIEKMDIQVYFVSKEEVKKFLNR